MLDNKLLIEIMNKCFTYNDYYIGRETNDEILFYYKDTDLNKHDSSYKYDKKNNLFNFTEIYFDKPEYLEKLNSLLLVYKRLNKLKKL